MLLCTVQQFQLVLFLYKLFCDKDIKCASYDSKVNMERVMKLKSGPHVAKVRSAEVCGLMFPTWH